MTHFARSIVVLILLTLASAAHSASCWQQVKTQLDEQGLSSADQVSIDNDAKHCLTSLLSDPATLNRALTVLTATDSGWAFLRDVHFAFKTFESQNDTTRAHLGFSYDYAKSFATTPLGQHCGDACVTALNVRFTTQGNVAFESDINPRNFLESHLNVAWFRSSGGARRLSADAQDRYNDLAMGMARIPAGHEEELQREYEKLARLIARNLTDQLYLEFGGDISFESDQSVVHKQMVYAARGALDFHGWSGLDAQTWEATPITGRINFFDYPFALLRILTGYRNCAGFFACFAPLATSWPTVSIAIGQVSPSSNDPRRQLSSGENSFTRMTAEASFKTPVAKIREQSIYVTANYRRYEELSPPAAVKQADLAHFNYFAAVLGPQRGFFLSYSTGRLPFDRRSDQVYELGFHTALN